MSRAPKVLLIFSSVLLALGAVMHASAFHKTDAAVAASNLAPFFGNSLRALWLADATTLWAVAALYALSAFKPSLSSRAVIWLTSFIPAATAFMLYVFLGAFFAGHLLMLAALTACIAGIMYPKNVHL